MEIKETSWVTGCGTSSCCIPSCTVIARIPGLCDTGTFEYLGDCLSNYQNPPKKDEDIRGCGGLKFHWRTLSGGVVVDVIEKANGDHIPFALGDCKAPQALPGGQCASADGGCSAQVTLA